MPPADLGQAPGERLLAVLAEKSSAVTLNELVAQVGFHANTVRARLQELVDAGLVAVQQVAPAGRGRPAHQYSITEQGRTAPRVNDPAFAEYRGLTTAFAGYLAARTEDPSEDARQIGRAWGVQLGAEVPRHTDDPTGRVVPLLARLGFTPVPPSSSAAREGIALRTCPLLELAEEMPEVICQVHQGLVEGALEQSGAAPTEVDLRPFSEPGACRLFLRQTEAATTSGDPAAPPDAAPDARP